MEDFTLDIKSIFTDDNFVVVKEGNSYDIKSNDDRPCLTITIYSDNIYIDGLEKCNFSGTESLDLIEKLAKRLGISKIVLTDASSIEIWCPTSSFISLTHLKLLTKGISWYNSLGYVSDDFEEEKRHNAVVLEKPFLESMHLVTQKMIDAFVITNSRERMMETNDMYSKKYKNSLKRDHSLKWNKNIFKG